MSESRSISRAELDTVKSAISDAERGRASLTQLARAHSICQRVGAIETAGLLRGHYASGAASASGSNLGNTLRSVGIGVISGTIVWAVLGRRR